MMVCDHCNYRRAVRIRCGHGVSMFLCPGEPERNEQCPCASGRKYKKCCG